jgi:predicted DNA-binding protein (UPF0251 family)
MTDFENMLAKHRRLSGEVTEQRSYLEFLEHDLAELEKEMNEFVATLQQAPTYVFDATSYPPISMKTLKPIPGLESVTIFKPEKASKSLRETARAIEEMGDGVDAIRLSQHLSISREAARLRLQRAAVAGLISRMASGRYRAIKRKPQEIKDEIATTEEKDHGREVIK